MTQDRKAALWFSEYFGLDCPQYQLPFVDFNLLSDVPLYIDPYAITKDPTPLGASCHNIIVSYFQTLLDAITSNQGVVVRQLVRGKMAEPNEIQLGVGKAPRPGEALAQIKKN